MLQPLVIGLGRSGAGLHLKALRNLASSSDGSIAPVIGCDPCPDATRDLSGVVLTGSPAEALRRVPDPAAVVAHVCTPPHDRLPLLRELADHGVTRMLVEKPLATSHTELDALRDLRAGAGLRITVVTHWLAAELTSRLTELVARRPYGPLRAVAVEQHKPRFTRSLASSAHAGALEVEVPHALALAVHLAGPARVERAHCADLRVGRELRRGLGGAEVALCHADGVRTVIRSDLTAPVRRRSVVLSFRDAEVTAHFPVGEDDDHAQLVLPGEDRRIFRDDAMLALFRAVYRPLPDRSPATDFTVAEEAARLLCEARSLVSPDRVTA
ncbi:Gfo/Idh/MocA family oxidoreductase [Streptomyces sp. NBC_01754]|uniref:Gfo/Idh/MocA family protein n=1 Tax=Streptomyces sp. NBC_01754 TaxID=2975930 RepID=UPI002DDAEA3A|nr:Gfo/Idh/MocA family oxidoreductase [Streptomyces sp. NBC_01754]WSC94907.1 Gfo/Idh/MocA family oxidoreductase [Streptomyces sp. NBC_01754]